MSDEHVADRLGWIHPPSPPANPITDSEDLTPCIDALRGQIFTIRDELRSIGKTLLAIRYPMEPVVYPADLSSVCVCLRGLESNLQSLSKDLIKAMDTLAPKR